MKHTFTPGDWVHVYFFATDSHGNINEQLRTALKVLTLDNEFLYLEQIDSDILKRNVIKFCKIHYKQCRKLKKPLDASYCEAYDEANNKWKRI